MLNQTLSLEAIIDLVATEIKGTKYAGAPEELYEPINYILQLGGKRLRPALVCLACDAFGGDVKASLPAAIGIEVFHNFSLVHDDIMDKASLRRGQLTVHEKWNQNIAILAGDTMLVKAYDSVLKGNYSSLREILEIFNKAAIEVCEGQQLDMNFELRDQVTVEEYLNMIKLKTSVLLGAALKIGAVIGGATKKQAQLLYDFGVNLGIGFQLMDDYLDAFGDPEKFGKEVGGDIVNNKKTFLLITALERDAERKLARLIDNDSLSKEDKVEQVKELFKELKADQACLSKMKEFYAFADRNLEELDIATEQKEALWSFSKYVQNRVQ